MARHEQTQAFAAHAGREPDSHLERADGYEFIHRLAPGSGIGEVDQVEDEPTRLLVKMSIEQAAAGNGQGHVVPGGPAYQVGEQVTVVREVVPAEEDPDPQTGMRCGSRGG